MNVRGCQFTDKRNAIDEAAAIAADGLTGPVDGAPPPAAATRARAFSRPRQPAAGPPARGWASASGCPRGRHAVASLGELLDPRRAPRDLRAERRQVVGLRLETSPCRPRPPRRPNRRGIAAGVADVGFPRAPGGDPPTANQIRLDERPGAVADRAEGLSVHCALPGRGVEKHAAASSSEGWRRAAAGSRTAKAGDRRRDRGGWTWLLC